MYYRIVFNNVPLVGFKDSLTRNFRTFYLLYDMKNWTYLTPSILENADFWNVFTKRNFLNSHICYIFMHSFELLGWNYRVPGVFVKIFAFKDEKRAKKNQTGSKISRARAVCSNLCWRKPTRAIVFALWKTKKMCFYKHNFAFFFIIKVSILI